MCFSIAASFGSSAVLVVMGIAAVSKLQHPSQIMFASIPIVFAIQQLIEGFVWLTLSNSNYSAWQNIPINAFIFFAQVVWPTWVPLSFLLIEKKLIIKKHYCF